MKVLYFDCFSGISGDMTLGALLDLGVDEQLFRKELDKLKLEGYKLVIEEIKMRKSLIAYFSYSGNIVRQALTSTQSTASAAVPARKTTRPM